MSHSKIVDAVRALVEPIVTDLGLELVEVFYGSEQGRWILRLTIDGPNGIGHDECQRVSDAVDAPLDAADPIPGSYYLEVSSPGLDRPLVKPADYVRFAGQKARLRTREPVDGRRNWQGVIAGFEADHVRLILDGQEEVDLPFDQIDRARIIPDFS